ncbi:MAG: helix-turn-helix domain-containing protein [Pyrinomonadaceae bacterium]|nr:helix-turn-helix domain-containing protein [Pyrinomonadaceae bacterium]
MRFDANTTDQAILKEIGERVAMIRLNQNLTQANLAEKSGVSKRTVERLEAGESVQITSLIRLLRSLGLQQRLEVLFPEPVASPIAQMKLQGKNRRRASTKRTPNSTNKAWNWGDES